MTNTTTFRETEEAASKIYNEAAATATEVKDRVEEKWDAATGTLNKATNAAVDYIRANDANQMLSDVKTLVKQNPIPSLVAAAFVGFLVGRAFTDSE